MKRVVLCNYVTGFSQSKATAIHYQHRMYVYDSTFFDFFFLESCILLKNIFLK